jgi:HAD superfamily phosphatase (TIGR01668 family)
MLRGLFSPDLFLSSVLQVNKAWLDANGIEALLLDIDNTLVSRETNTATDQVCTWLKSLLDQGYRVHLLTNNWHREVLATAAALGLPVIHRAIKPLPFGFLSALKALGANRKKTLMVGDQLMTDVLGAKLVGLRTVLVVPLSTTDLFHTKLLRNLEKFLLGNRQPEPMTNENNLPTADIF